MKKISNRACFLVIFLAAIACSNQDSGVIRKIVPAGEKENVQSGKTEDDPNKGLDAEQVESSGSGLFLSWTKATATSPVLSYRIYSSGGNDLATGGELIRTITAPAGKEIPVEMELTKDEAAKAQGGKLCLYMIAANGSLSSEASATACLAL